MSMVALDEIKESVKNLEDSVVRSAKKISYSIIERMGNKRSCERWCVVAYRVASARA